MHVIHSTKSMLRGELKCCINKLDDRVTGEQLLHLRVLWRISMRDTNLLCRYVWNHMLGALTRFMRITQPKPILSMKILTDYLLLERRRFSGSKVCLSDNWDDAFNRFLLESRCVPAFKNKRIQTTISDIAEGRCTASCRYSGFQSKDNAL